MELSPQQDVYYIDTVSPIDYFIDTVISSAIQLNKEKTMSIELDGPLYLGSNSMQQQVDQNTTDIADLKQDVSDIETDIGNLNNLDTVDKSSVVNAINEALSVLDPTQTADYINNSKGLKSGDVSTNSIILNDIKDYAHSTFDLSKFTVVGSPNITDDGIVSGFSSGVITMSSFTLGVTSKWEIILKIKTPSSNPNYAARLLQLGTSSTEGYFELWYGEIDGSSGIRFKITPPSSSTATIILASTTANSDYWFKLGYDGSEYYLYYSTDGSNYIQVGTPQTLASISAITNKILYIGNWSSNYTRGFTGSIDLKQFSITVGGVEVFSGNKTGIDTIKADDYTVFTRLFAYSDGTHTIYANAASLADVTKLYNANGSNYTGSDFVLDTTNHTIKYNGTDCSYVEASNIELNTVNDAIKVTTDGVITYSDKNGLVHIPNNIRNQLLTANTWKIQFAGTIPNENAYFIGNVYPAGNIRGDYVYILRGSNTMSCFIRVNNNGTRVEYVKVSALSSSNNGEPFTMSVEFTGTQYIWEFHVGNNATVTEVVASTTDKLYSYTIPYDIFRIGGYLLTGSIDLNAFKIYVDGNLVYQPCLKIPYTESKTGSKIVDSIYRDRVADMSAQFGYANYYTLDEDNGNFTLPQVELYGLIGQRTLRDSYRNGINYWELYSNRDLEQGGSCTSGVEVTFARPFADTNYVLSVPYSAKSTTAFTPTQTGDWIAKGKGLL